MAKPRVIAFYLPQYHPIPENDEWWGKGFTEWTNVARARPLFPGHYQPRIPADLGFYDLRVPEVRERQAELARNAGIEGFCYYHYWFGSKNTPKELMQLPFNEVVRTGKPDFPFCLCWANHSWEKKDWDAKTAFLNRTVLVKQEYYGIEDYEEHFYSLLPAFKDGRYIKVDGKLLFVVYRPDFIPDMRAFMNCWNGLAAKNNIPRFCFVGNYFYSPRMDTAINEPPYSLCDANICEMLPVLTNDRIGNRFDKIVRYAKKVAGLITGYPVFKMDYARASKKLLPPKGNAVIPEIVSGFDHSPRTKNMRLIMHRFTPDAFRNHVRDVFAYLDDTGGGFDRIVFLKSWNEWGEGNYVEPDLKYGCQFLDVLRDEILNSRGGVLKCSIIFRNASLVGIRGCA